MERQDIDDELSTTGAQELLTSTSAAHLASSVQLASSSALGPSMDADLAIRPGAASAAALLRDVHVEDDALRSVQDRAKQR